MTVTLDSVRDLRGNKLAENREVEFTMAIADLKLEQVVSVFSLDIPMNGDCTSEALTMINPSTVRDSVALQLAIDKTRIEVAEVTCSGSNMNANVKVKPVRSANDVSQRRLGSPATELKDDTITAMEAYDILAKASKAMQGHERGNLHNNARRLVDLSDSSFTNAGIHFTLGK